MKQNVVHHQFLLLKTLKTVIPPELPYCWFGLVNSISPYAYVQTLGYNGIDNSYCVGLYNSDDPSPSLLFISPQIEGGVAGKYVNFFAWGYDGPLSVGTIADPSDESTFNEIATVTLSDMYRIIRNLKHFLPTIRVLIIILPLKQIQPLHMEVLISIIS